MAWASKTYTFSPSTTIASAEVNQNFDDMVDGLDTAMPSGMICMWSGSSASIPSGWYLCDGNNSTPNLVNRFVVGATGTYAVGATGGEATHVLTEAEMPSHYHTTQFYGDGDAGAGSYWAQSNNSSANRATNTNSKGSGAAHNNLPPYYALCFVMKS